MNRRRINPSIALGVPLLVASLTLLLLVSLGYLNWSAGDGRDAKKEMALLKSLESEVARGYDSEALIEAARKRARLFKAQLLTAAQFSEFSEECRRGWRVELEGSQDTSDFTRSILRVDKDDVSISEWPTISAWLERTGFRKGIKLLSASIEATGGIERREFKRISLRIALYCEKGSLSYQEGER